MKHLLVIIFAALTLYLGATDLRIAPGMALRKRACSAYENIYVVEKQNLSPTLSVQLGMEIKGFTIGIGADLQKDEQVPKFVEDSTNTGVDIDCFPIYGVLTYRFPSEMKMKPEIVAQLGTSNNKWNDKWVEGNYVDCYRADDGLFYALGMGLQRGKWSLQALYRVNTVPVNISYYRYGVLDDEEDFDYRISQINVSLGYHLNLHK